MICVRLSGGLGNQMFQYACGKALANKFNTKLILDTTFLEKKSPNAKHTLRDYELGIFLPPNNILSASEKIQCRFLYLIRTYYKLRQYVGTSTFNSKKFIIENSAVSYDRRIEKMSKHCMLIGNWQNEKYFSEVNNLITERFSFKLTLDKLNSDRSNRILNSNSISIHIRRGDYVENPGTNKTHGVCSLEYYKSAIRLIMERVGNPVFFIFSDDLKWARENLKVHESHEYISGNIEGESYIDMQLMSLCKHNIIANSTFSWWGAWLNQNPKKIVIAPKQWFANDTKNAKANDSIPGTWIRL